MQDFEATKREILKSAEKELKKACELNKFEPVCEKLQSSVSQETIEITKRFINKKTEGSKENVATNLDKLLEVFPHIPLNECGLPKMCALQFGLKDIERCFEHIDCKACWSQPYKENTNE